MPGPETEALQRAVPGSEDETQSRPPRGLYGRPGVEVGVDVLGHPARPSTRRGKGLPLRAKPEATLSQYRPNALSYRNRIAHAAAYVRIRSSNGTTSKR